MEVRSVGDVKVVSIMPRLDAHAAIEGKEAMDGLLEGGAAKILCDFSRTEFISSSGLRLLLAAAKRLASSGGELILCALKPRVYGVFETAGMLHLFTICATEEEALKSFK